MLLAYARAALACRFDALSQWPYVFSNSMSSILASLGWTGTSPSGLRGWKTLSPLSIVKLCHTLRAIQCFYVNCKVHNRLVGVLHVQPNVYVKCSYMEKLPTDLSFMEGLNDDCAATLHGVQFKDPIYPQEYLEPFCPPRCLREHPELAKGFSFLRSRSGTLKINLITSLHGQTKDFDEFEAQYGEHMVGGVVGIEADWAWQPGKLIPDSIAVEGHRRGAFQRRQLTWLQYHNFGVETRLMRAQHSRLVMEQAFQDSLAALFEATTRGYATYEQLDAPFNI